MAVQQVVLVVPEQLILIVPEAVVHHVVETVVVLALEIMRFLVVQVVVVEGVEVVTGHADPHVLEVAKINVEDHRVLVIVKEDVITTVPDVGESVVEHVKIIAPLLVRPQDEYY